MEIKVIIATHKKVNLPKGGVYLPIHVGRVDKEDIGFVGDNTGDNISEKNPYYSELTSVYWAWKNLKADFIGLVHYRRFFAKRSFFGLRKRILISDDIIKLCKRHDLILPRKRKYFIESLKTHYGNTHDIRHLDEVRRIIQHSSPTYLGHYDRVIKRRSAHMFNMFIMKRPLFNEYCHWLFSILFQLEKTIDFDKLSAFDARLMGRVSELLMDVWIEKNELQYKEVALLEKEAKFWVKLRKFLAAKFLNRKYKQSA